MYSNVKKVKIEAFADSRGCLIALEKGSSIPFDPKRVYCIYNVPKDHKRGSHAHIKLSQLLVATSGTVTIKCLYNHREEEYILNTPDEGLLIEGLVWREMYNFSSDAVLMVLASEYYDEGDYIRCYEDFIRFHSEL